MRIPDAKPTRLKHLLQPNSRVLLMDVSPRHFDIPEISLLLQPKVQENGKHNLPFPLTHRPLELLSGDHSTTIIFVQRLYGGRSLVHSN